MSIWSKVKDYWENSDFLWKYEFIGGWFILCLTAALIVFLAVAENSQ